MAHFVSGASISPRRSGSSALFKISEKDWMDVAVLTREVHETPAIVLGGTDFKKAATQRVFDKWLEIGERMGFDGHDVRPVDVPNRIVRAKPLPRVVLVQ